MHVLVLDVELHLPEAQSLKEKRSIIQSVIRTLDGWKGVGVAEVAHLHLWQRSGIGIVIVGGTLGHVHEVAEAVERHLWTRSGAEVVRLERHWVEHDPWDGS